MIKSRAIWPGWYKINDKDHSEFIILIAGIGNEAHPLFKDLLLLESSLNSNMDWDMLQVLIQNMLYKNVNNA